MTNVLLFVGASFIFPHAVSHSYLHSADEGQKWSLCDGQMQVEERRQNGEGRRVRSSSENPRREEVDMWNNNNDHNTLPIFFPISPPPSFPSLILPIRPPFYLSGLFPSSLSLVFLSKSLEVDLWLLL